MNYKIWPSTLKSLINEQGGDLLKKSNGLFRGTIRLYFNVLFMSYSTLDEVSKLVPNLEYLFSFIFQLKNAATKFCFLGHLHAVKVP